MYQGCARWPQGQGQQGGPTKGPSGALFSLSFFCSPKQKADLMRKCVCFYFVKRVVGISASSDAEFIRSFFIAIRSHRNPKRAKFKENQNPNKIISMVTFWFQFGPNLGPGPGVRAQFGPGPFGRVTIAKHFSDLIFSESR